jgi:hypothetical protein
VCGANRSTAATCDRAATQSITSYGVVYSSCTRSLYQRPFDHYSSLWVCPVWVG